MHRIVTRYGIVALFSLMLATPALAQDWSTSVDVPIGDSATFMLTFDNGDGINKLQKVENIGTAGLMLNVTTPYHVGFGLESYRVRLLPEPGDKKFVLDFDVHMLDVYVEVPVTSWLIFAPGTGWGKASLKAEGKSSDFEQPEDTNLWQWYAVFGVKLPWSLQARLGYHELRGKVVDRHGGGDTSTQEMKLSLTTIGLGYTF